MDETKSTVDLSGNLFVIDVKDPYGIPAVEMDLYTGSYNVLVFTSLENAQRYCYFRNPVLRSGIKQLTKKFVNREMKQVGLIRIVRSLCSSNSIKTVVFDHPGYKGSANYVTISDLKQFLEGHTQKNELMDFLDSQ